MMNEQDIMEYEMNQMKTFKDYLNENTETGNYVALQTTSQSKIWNHYNVQEPVSGDVPPDYHCTLIYSKDTMIRPSRIMDIINTSGWGDSQFLADGYEIDCFDSESDDKSCLVLKLKCSPLNKIHELLKLVGLKHSYDDFKPHVTLRYNMSIPEAHYYRDKMNTNHTDYMVQLSGFKSQAIVDKNYV